MATLDVPASLPRARKSLSALNDPNNTHIVVQPSLIRSESDDVTARGLAGKAMNKSKDALKRRAMSIGGNAIIAGVTDPALKSLSPRSFRRAAVSFFSIEIETRRFIMLNVFETIEMSIARCRNPASPSSRPPRLILPVDHPTRPLTLNDGISLDLMLPCRPRLQNVLLDRRRRP